MHPVAVCTIGRGDAAMLAITGQGTQRLAISGDTRCLSVSHASHSVPAANPREAGGYYNRYYTS
jgi:hypothetical protein